MATQPKSELKRIQISVDAPVAQIRLNNPAQNVIDVSMMEELAASVRNLEGQSQISTLVFAGNAEAFSAGVDVAAHEPDIVREMLTKFHAVVRALVNSKKVTIAVVRGNCLGGGA